MVISSVACDYGKEEWPKVAKCPRVAKYPLFAYFPHLPEQTIKDHEADFVSISMP